MEAVNEGVEINQASTSRDPMVGDEGDDGVG